MAYGKKQGRQDHCFHPKGFHVLDETVTSKVTITTFACKGSHNGPPCGFTKRTVNGVDWPWRIRVEPVLV